MDYVRKQKTNVPIIAFCYDFDRTLSPWDMQAQGYIQDVGYDVDVFWRKTAELVHNNGMDDNLAYMYLMVKEAVGHFPLTKDSLAGYGEKVSFYPGVKDWFKRINAYCADKGFKAEHYIISSGIKEMIEGTAIADEFEAIYACAFYFDKCVAVWPAQSVNYTNKTQFLFRISKGCTDVTDPSVNDYMPFADYYVPFNRMVYVGDSMTDIPCMKLLTSYEGYAIGVYDPETANTAKVQKLLTDGRIRYGAAADYREGKELDVTVKGIIDDIAAKNTVR